MKSGEINSGILTGVKESRADTTIIILCKTRCSYDYKYRGEEKMLETAHVYDRLNLYVSFLNKGG